MIIGDKARSAGSRKKGTSMSSLENSVIKWKNYLNVAFILKLTKLGAGESFRGFAALKKKLGSVPRIHSIRLTTSHNSSPMGSDTPSWHQGLCPSVIEMQ